MEMFPFSSRLPDHSNWSFEKIEIIEPKRASALEHVGNSEALVASLEGALRNAQQTNNLRLGREHLDGDWSIERAVVQFHVGKHLYDWFFNGRTGYRAHFRAHHKCGIEFNNKILGALCAVLEAGLPDVVNGRHIGPGFSDCGVVEITKSFLRQSLVPTLTKVWNCTTRIGLHGGTEEMPSGVSGEPKLILPDGRTWVAIYCADDDLAWLDIKGGFLGKTRVYQTKNPFKRARRLQDSGEA